MLWVSQVSQNIKHTKLAFLSIAGLGVNTSQKAVFIDYQDKKTTSAPVFLFGTRLFDLISFSRIIKKIDIGEGEGEGEEGEEKGENRF